jgi:hypothetical protein
METFDDDRSALSRYLEILDRLAEPPGDAGKGELEIVRDRDAILVHARILRKEIGIMYEDQYVYLLRDAVLFPPRGSAGVPTRGAYIRLVYKNRLEGNPGVFTLTVDAGRRLVLNRAFRHSTRHWMLEGQGTIAKPGESLEASVARCVNQEIGRPLVGLQVLCEDFVSERGLVGDAIPLMLATVGGEPIGAPDDPSVAGHVVLAPEAYEAALLEGRYDVGGIPHRLRDGYTVSAFHLAKARKLL